MMNSQWSSPKTFTVLPNSVALGHAQRFSLLLLFSCSITAQGETISHIEKKKTATILIETLTSCFFWKLRVLVN